MTKTLVASRHQWGEDATIADRVRSELGPVLKALDSPRVHIAVADGIVSLHGDVADAATRTAVEASVMSTAGVRGLDTHLHLGLLPSDTRPSTSRRALSAASAGGVDTLTARDVMTSAVISVSPGDTPFAAYDLITTHRIHHLPVIGPDGRCIQILDPLTAIARATESWTHGRAPLVELTGEVRPVGVLPTTSLQRVASLMTAAGVDACCVVDEHGRMVGLITARDIIAAVADPH